MKVTVTFFFVLFAAIAHSQLLNGGFETNQCTNTLWCDYGGGFIPGQSSWDIVSGTIDLVQTSNQFTCIEGSWCVDLNGGNAGQISQDFTTIAGHTYELTWSQSGNYEGVPTDKLMSVGVTFPYGAAVPPVSTYSYDTTGLSAANMGSSWESRSYYFWAPNSFATVYFTSNSISAYGMFIDAITLIDTTTPVNFCAGVDESQWTYDQGYYCTNSGRGFFQCFGGPSDIESIYQPCPLGTVCQCPDGNTECSHQGTQSPCQ